MTGESRLNTARLVAENRQLRATLEELLDELESSGTAKGHGENPDRGPDCECVREALPDTPGHGNREDEGIQPPWEREGYNSKGEWIKDRGNSE